MSDIKDTLLNITRSVTKTSGDLFKTTKLSVSLANEQEVLKNIYTGIGKKVHEIYLYGGSLGKFFDEQYKNIVACEQRIDDIKEKINTIKGTRDCPKCGKSVERVAEFCPKCGARVDGLPLGAGTRPPAPPEADYHMPAVPAFEPPPPYAEAGESPSDYAPGAETSEPPPTFDHPAADIPVPPPAPAAVSRKCPVCGTENSAGERYCLSCGRIL
ncbi:MAG: zinc-ribbon domain-containing protein [Clostridiales bacterium]|jgi:endogenous inhibitor of DNA gyrase (YacG/DUF329 family)|nr:zinc-ribbon domain-containing protein [Clostridiales bacterium]